MVGADYAVFFWGRYLPRHDFRWTTFQVALLATSITGAVRLRRLAAATLRGDPRRSFLGIIRTMRSIQAYSASATFVVTGVAFMLVSIGAIRGVPPGEGADLQYADARGAFPAKANAWWYDWGWVPRVMALVHYSPFANLKQADVSVKPPNWTGKNESDFDLVKGAELAGADLRYADARGAFLAKANLEDAWLESAELDETDLRQAKLGYAQLGDARLTWAVLIGAVLSMADLTEASLQRADLTKALLIGAVLTRAHLAGAHLTGANLSGAQLGDARLGGAHLNGANLSGAVLQPSLDEFLNFGTMAGTDLTGARLTSADLTGAHLTSADLRFADFRSLHGPNDKTKGLAADQLKAAKNWDEAYYDEQILRQLGLPPDHNQKLEEEQKREEQQKGQPAANAPASTASQPGAGQDKSAKH